MASPARRRPDKVLGDFFVDASCLDCDTCRWMAPATFDRARGQSRVHTQPVAGETTLRALQALVSCPTASIGTTERHEMDRVTASFPIPMTTGDEPSGATRVYHCGYHAESSFGAASWLVVRPEGNILVDSPRFAAPLAARIDELGGVATIFLTHCDDVADHARWAEHFGAGRVLHERDVGLGTYGVERWLSGDAPVALGAGVEALPVPGHTQGSTCLLVDRHWLFSGDHLAWNRDEARLTAFRDACWYDWTRLQESMRRLLAYDFEWVLPGHGAWVHLPASRMRAELARCIDALAA